jgi:hypothetical protein
MWPKNRVPHSGVRGVWGLLWEGLSPGQTKDHRAILQVRQDTGGVHDGRPHSGCFGLAVRAEIAG